MTLPDGTPKGMKMVIEERGVCTEGKKVKDMVKILKGYDDVKQY